MKIRKDQLGAILRRQLTAALDGGPEDNDRRKALDYFYARPRGDEIAGNPAVQSTDVRDMTHAVLAQILPSFTGDQLCYFQPDGPQDDKAAVLESDATNRVMMESSRGYIQISAAIKDSLLLKSGILKVWLDECEYSETVDYGPLSGPALKQVSQPVPRGTVQVERTAEGVTVRRTTTERKVRMAAVDPLRFVVDPNQTSPVLTDCRFCGESKLYSRAELVDMGLSRQLIEKVPRLGSSSTTTVASRFRAGIEPINDPANWAGELVEVWEIYARLDLADTGREQLYRFLLGEQTVLLQEDADYVPYAAGSPFLEPHRFWGLSLYDVLKTVQDAKTLGIRQWLQNLANGNLNRTLANENVVMDDLTNGRSNGVVRVKTTGPVSDNAVPFPFADTGGSSLQFLAYMDQVRADRGGAALQLASAEMQATGTAVGSQGVDRIFSVQEQLAGWIARNLAETLLRSAFLLVHRVLRTELVEPLTLPLADQWVQVDPRTWRRRDRVDVRGGLSPGEKARKAAALGNVVQLQTQALQLGLDGVLVGLPELYAAMIDWARAAELDGAARYFADPAGQASQQVGQQKSQQARQQQQLALQLQQAQIQLQTQALQLEGQKLQLDKYKADQEMGFKYADARLSAEIEEAKLTATVTADLAAAQRDAGTQAQRLNGSAAAGTGGAGGA